MSHEDLSRRPIRLLIVRTSTHGTPCSAAAQATPYPSIASATAFGCASASAAARASVPVIVASVSTVPTCGCRPATASASRIAAHRGDGSGPPPPSPSPVRSRKPSSVAAPRSANSTTRETTTLPTLVRPAKPPAIPAAITRSTPPSKESSRLVATAAATGPTPLATAMTSPTVTAGYGRSAAGLASPSRPTAASRSAATAVTTSVVIGSRGVGVDQRELPEAAGLAFAWPVRQRHHLDLHGVAPAEVGGQREVAPVLLDGAGAHLVRAVHHPDEPPAVLDHLRHLHGDRGARPHGELRRRPPVLPAVPDLAVRLTLEAPQRRLGLRELATGQRADLGDRLLTAGEDAEREGGGSQGREDGATGRHPRSSAGGVAARAGGRDCPQATGRGSERFTCSDHSRRPTRAAATAMPTAATSRPHGPASGMMPIAPPVTKASWSSVSEWANALALLSSGSRSWITASTPSLASPVASAVTNASATAVGRLYAIAAPTQASATTARLAHCSAMGRCSRIR